MASSTKSNRYALELVKQGMVIDVLRLWYGGVCFQLDWALN